MRTYKNIFKKCTVICMLVCSFVMLCGFTSPQQKVYDNAQLLSSDEEAKLQSLCLEYIAKTESDIVVVTTNTLDGKSVVAYADDYFDYNGFGYNKEMGDGIILVIDMEDRELAISTSGKLVSMLSENQTDSMVSEVASYLTDGDYYAGCQTFVESFYQEYNYSLDAGKRERMMTTLIEVLISLVVGGIITGVIYSGHSTKMTVNGYTYAKNHKCDIRRQSDIYTNTTRTVRTIDNGGSSGGGSHVGSSGNRHGGSSGKF